MGVAIALYALWVIGAVVFLLVQWRSPTATLAWLVAFIFLPVLSVLWYFGFGPVRMQRRKMQRNAAKALARRIGAFTPGEIPQTLASRLWLTSLARVPMSEEEQPPRPSVSATTLRDGDATYAAIEAAMRAAQSQIHLEYYIFESDTVGTRWRDILVERARAGVKVRILLDAVGAKDIRRGFWRALEDAGGEVRHFNPISFRHLQPGLINFRTHRKIVVVDGWIGFTGGINIADGHSESASGNAAWRDTHLRVVGPPAQDLQRTFLEDWVYAVRPRGLLTSFHRGEANEFPDIDAWFPQRQDALHGPWVQVIDSGPDERTSDTHRFVFSAISLARRRCWVTTPYFVPDDAIIEALCAAKSRGVDVRLIVPKKGDSRVVTAAARTFAWQVARERVEVFEYSKRMIHAKTFVIDDELAIVGTVNIDNRSFRQNFEVMAAIYDKGVNADVAAHFLADQAAATQLDPSAPLAFSTRLVGGAARLFAPLL